MYFALLFMWVLKIEMLERNGINESLKIKWVLWNGNWEYNEKWHQLKYIEIRNSGYEQLEFRLSLLASEPETEAVCIISQF